MHDRIAGYLEQAGRPMPAGQILREALNILSPNAAAADRVLKGILGSDPRFRRQHGLWLLAARAAPPAVEVAALSLRWNAAHPLIFQGAIHVPALRASFPFERTPAAVCFDGGLLREARRRAENHLLLVWDQSQLRRWNALLHSCGLPAWEGDSMHLNALAGRVFPHSPPKSPEGLASLLGLALPDAESPAAAARFLASAFPSLLELVPAEHRGNLSDIEAWIAEGSPRVDFSRFAFGPDLLAGLPESPGVYLMRNRAGEVIYVGKSHNLRRRVRSYFTRRALKDAKAVRIHSHLHSIEVLTCATEIEALLLEMRMIRDFRPTINLQVEIHERKGRYGTKANLLLLVPAGDAVEIYMIREGAFAARMSVPLGRSLPRKLATRIRTVYFGRRRRNPAGIEDWEAGIVAQFISSHRKHLNLIDVDETGSCEELLRVLPSYLGDPARLRSKVYYR